MGETQEERITQFLEENEAPVLGLREGSMLWVQGSAAILKGPHTARIFRLGESLSRFRRAPTSKRFWRQLASPWERLHER
jgi:hypothetical protein